MGTGEGDAAAALELELAANSTLRSLAAEVAVRTSGGCYPVAFTLPGSRWGDTALPKRGMDGAPMTLAVAAHRGGVSGPLRLRVRVGEEQRGTTVTVSKGGERLLCYVAPPDETGAAVAFRCWQLSAAHQPASRELFAFKGENLGDNTRSGYLIKPSMRVSFLVPLTAGARGGGAAGGGAEGACIEFELFASREGPLGWKRPRAQPVSRLVAAQPYGYAHDLGLVLVASAATQACGLTPARAKFVAAVDEVEAGGDTALRDGLMLAIQMLRSREADARRAEQAARGDAQQQAQPQGPGGPQPPAPPAPRPLALRILALSDGEDTS